MVVFSCVLLCVLAGALAQVPAVPVPVPVPARGGQPLEVARGRHAYLQPNRHLIVRATGPGERCWIRVVSSDADPASQRPGRLTPSEFPCDVDGHSVIYTHYGAATPSNDRVSLLVRYDTREDTLIIPVTLHVLIMPSPEPLLITRNLPLVVSAPDGRSAGLSSELLNFNFDRASGHSCRLVVRAAPTHGNLHGPTQGECDSIIEVPDTLYYQHNGQPGSPDRDYIPMLVEVTAPNGNVVDKEYFQVVVMIEGLPPNQAPRIRDSALLLLEVNQFVLTPLTLHILAAEDAETPDDLLVFNVTTPLGYGEGEILCTDDPSSMPASSFYQRDIRALKIAYRPPASDSTSKRVFEIELQVVDPEGAVSAPVLLVIVVHPKNTLAPMASRNAGLSLLEGQTRRLLPSRHLELSDEDNIEDVVVTVVDGLRYGTLLLMDTPALTFTPADLDAGLIAYRHSGGSEAAYDNIVFRVSDGDRGHDVQFLFPVTVFPVDDEAPTLVTNVAVDLMEVDGAEVRLTTLVLSATDVDSGEEDIQFRMLQPSSYGVVMLDLPQGKTAVSNWSQPDIVEGRLLYRYNGSKEPPGSVLEDTVRFILHDAQQPPNESPVHELLVSILPADKTPPQPAPGCPMEIHVAEGQLTIISGRELRFEDASDAVMFRVTRPPDLGRLVLFDEPGKALNTFSQAQIEHHKIAYLPPAMELGLETRTVTMRLQAIDHAGNVAPDQVFTVVLEPVDNQPPLVHSTGLEHVQPGTAVVLTPAALDAEDVDTPRQRLQFRVKRAPLHGALSLSGTPLDPGAVFERADLAAGRLRYLHGGAKSGGDDLVTLEVTDGLHSVPALLRIGVEMADPQPYSLQVMAIMPGLTVEEGQATIVTPRILQVSDSADQALLFLVEERPNRGQLQVSGQVADRFTLSEVESGSVRYQHTAGEIGLKPQYDRFVLSASDVSYGNLIEVNVTVSPVDNSPPKVEVCSKKTLTVPEGGRGNITEKHLKVTDVDSSPEDLQCTVIAQPLFGYLVDTTPSPGSEVLRSDVPVSAFPYVSVLRGSLQYVQSIHRDMEPREDGFSITCFDIASSHRKQSSDAILIFPIMISPVNDEAPQLAPRQMVVMEGLEALVDLAVLNAVDLDSPADPLTFQVLNAPRHGRLISHDVLTDEADEVVESFTINQLDDIMYSHDDSETLEDSFILSLSDGVHTSTAEVPVMIIPRDDETPRLTINNGIELDVGDSVVITNDLLRAEDEDSEDSLLRFIVRNPPVYGDLILYMDYNDTDVKLLNGFNFSQADVDDGNLKYAHNGINSNTRDIFKFDVTDGFNTLVGNVFYFNIKAEDIAYPDIVNKGVDLTEGGTVVLTTDILSTSDIDSDDSLLVFNIVRPPSRGRLESSDAPGISIPHFTQLQLAGNKIRYVHTSKEEGVSRGDNFEFEVTDGHNSVYRTFRITLSEADNKRPVLYIQELVVTEGAERLITPFELNIVDRDSTPDRLWLNVIQSPMHGFILYNRSIVCSSFSMKDVLENEISYSHDGSETTEDAFSVVVSDGVHEDFAVFPALNVATQLPQRVVIRVIPVDDSSPCILVNKIGIIGSLQESGFQERLGLRIGNDLLRASDPDSPAQALQFLIERPPTAGQLVNNLGSPLENFTQGDLDAGNVLYLLREGANDTSDSFQFSVKDVGENELSSQVFWLRWCWISLLSEVHLINETDGVLAVTLRRRGHLRDTSFVSILVEGRTAVSGEDFHDGSMAQVQFNPEQSEATWLLHLEDDPHYEREEELLLRLQEPIMAVLETPSWATVTIKDPEDESTVFFPTVVYEVEEDSGEVMIEVQRTGDLSSELMVQCITEKGTAVGTGPLDLQSYSDYISRPAGLQSTIKFHSAQQQAVCPVLLIDDSLYEPEERFWIHLIHPIGGRLGQHSAQIIILSDTSDVPMIYFGEESYTVDESAGQFEVAVWRSGSDLTQPSSVVVRSKPSLPISAKVGFDYIGVGQTLKFAPGINMMPFTVTLLDDIGQPRIEGPETFMLVLRLPMNAILGKPDEVTVTINDTVSDLPKMQFQQTNYSISEESGELRVPVWKSGDLSQTSSVRCYTQQGSATAGIDFEERPNINNSMIIFEPGEMDKDCVVKIINDTKYESDETFTLVLGSPTSDAWGTAHIGFINVTTVTIKDDSDQPAIKFGKTRMYVQEPKEPVKTVTLKVPVLREGDKSQLSVTRIHTKDGSAKSGKDYIGKSAELKFLPNVNEITFEVEVLKDQEKENQETFTIHLKPDMKNVSQIKDHRLIVYIEDKNTIADVTFPAPPFVVSLRDYDNAISAATNPIGGYPLVCITACNSHHPNFQKMRNLCAKAGINDTATEYHWQLSTPMAGINEMREITTEMFVARSRQAVLDSIYFSAGNSVRCATRAVNVEGIAGLQLYSKVVTISKEEGICLPNVPGSFGAEPFTAKLKYIGSDDRSHPNFVQLSILIPHRDGMLPAISTQPLSNLELILRPNGIRIGSHKCSNLLDYTEVKTKYGFNNNMTKNIDIIGEMEPYQFSADMRGDSTLRFYQNLDLESCLWHFESYYTMNELITDCGGSISTEGQLSSMVQSSLLVEVPLYISYIFHTGVLQHSEQETKLRLVFVYDSAIIWQHGINPPKGFQQQGYLYPTSMRIDQDGHLVVQFRTEARFHGMFVLSHTQSSSVSTVISEENPDLTCALHLIRTEPTFSQPQQEWEFVSDLVVQDYSGTYAVKLIPCEVTEDIPYSSSASCNPQKPVMFELQVRFQQVSDPVPAEFSLDTHFYLTKQRELWLSSNSDDFLNDWDSSFQPGDTIYGRIMVDPIRSFGNSLVLSIEKCFLCAGVDGYVPKYNPQEEEFGCIVDSSNLQYNFKIIDKSSPRSVVSDFQNISFSAMLSDGDMLPEKQMDNAPGSDGFSFSPDPLFKVTQGRQWFIHCIYTVASRQTAGQQLSKRDTTYDKISILSYENRSKRDTRDAQGLGKDGKGTNLHHIELQSMPEMSHRYQIVDKSNFQLWWLAVTTGVLLIVIAVMIACGCNIYKKGIITRTRTKDNSVIICDTSKCKSTEQTSTKYSSVPFEDRTEV